MASSITSRRAATLPVSFFRRPAEIVARELVGTLIVSTVRGVLTAGRIVETEAYLGHRDPASHAFANRRHARNENLYGPAGTWYVYLSYGMHWCGNAVCGEEGEGTAVLLRALAPLTGIPAMRTARGGIRPDTALCSGPAKLCQTLGIDRRYDGTDLTVPTRAAPWIGDDGTPVKGKRIVSEINRVFGDNTILVKENGGQDLWSYYWPYYQSFDAGCVVPPAEQTVMGLGVIGAIAAKMAAPERQVVSTTGDGAFQMAMHELPTAVQEKAPVTWVVMNDGARHEWRSRPCISRRALRPSNPRYACSAVWPSLTTR